MKNFTKGSQNAVKCINIKSSDRVVIVTDREKRHIAESIRYEIKKIKAKVLWLVIEDEIGERPVEIFPNKLRNKIRNFKPNVSYYIASGKKGELQKFRSPLIKFLTKDLKCRHAHMINIDDKIMLEGMSMDYDQVFKMTMKVYNVVKNSKKIRVKADDTNLIVELSPSLKWKPCTGRITKQGDWNNLPEGEVFTCPLNVNGSISAYIIGDFFSEKYGVLKYPLKIKIKDSRIRSINCKSKRLLKEFREYIKKNANGDRVGEFAIGTLVGLKEFIGNLLQDEKFPGIHIAFGHPYPEHTEADWDCPTHVDVIPKNCSIWIDSNIIMRKGKFLKEFK